MYEKDLSRISDQTPSIGESISLKTEQMGEYLKRTKFRQQKSQEDLVEIENQTVQEEERWQVEKAYRKRRRQCPMLDGKVTKPPARNESLPELFFSDEGYIAGRFELVQERPKYGGAEGAEHGSDAWTLPE